MGQKSIECDNFRWMVRSDFARALKRNGLPLRRYKVGKAKSCEDLWIQVVLGTCRLKKFGYLAQSLPPKVSSTLYRSVRTVVVELSARIGGNDRFLLLKHQVQEEGACRYRLHVAPEIHMFADEKPSDALVRFAVRELNLTERSWNQHFVIEDCTTFKRWQESLSFPGLLTLYDISKYRVNIQDPHHSDLLCFGLPEGNEFKTTTENSMDKYHSVFTWVSRKDFENILFTNSVSHCSLVPWLMWMSCSVRTLPRKANTKMSDVYQVCTNENAHATKLGQFHNVLFCWHIC